MPFGSIMNIFKSRPSRSFEIELEKETNEDHVARVGDILDMLSRCPKDAKVAFGVNEGGNMRLLIDTFLHYNHDLNEVVLYPFNRPTEEVDMDIPPNEDT